MSSIARTAQTDKTNRRLLFGAGALALLAAIFVFASLTQLGDSGGGSGVGIAGAVDVVVASRDISAGTTITSDMLSIATLPGEGVVDGVVKDKSVATGLVVRYPMAKGEQFTSAKLGQTQKDSDFAYVIPSGKRAVAVEVSENTSVGGLIVAGDRVDVIGVFSKSNNSTADQLPQAFTLLQDVEVLAVAQKTQKAVTRLDKDGNPIQTDTAEGSLATRPENTDANAKARTITLAVSPDDAPLLALAQDQGKVWLTLRGFGDGDSPDIAPRTLPQ